MIKKLAFALFLFAGLSLYAQENPSIDIRALAALSPDPNSTRQAIRQGDRYFNRGLYDAALQQYMRVFSIVDNHSPLNYKIAVSNLFGINPRNALYYFNRTDSWVASDYYSMKGIALIYHQRFDEARRAFQQYLESLPPRQAQRETGRINRLIAIADFSTIAIQDSLPVFIINAGPNVNSYWDDYSAVEFLSPEPTLFFTSRRPRDNSTDISSSTEHRERIFFSPEFVNGVASEAIAAQMTGRQHMSIAGVDNNTNSVLYFRGKKRNGDIFRVQFRENRTSRNSRLNNTISSRMFAEGAISFADNGDAYFISNRPGGQGGNDIWFARRRGNNSFYRPVNLSNLNTPLNEQCVFVTPDGNTLYFSSNGHPGFGGLDIFRSERQPDGSWGAPVNMGHPINGPGDDLFFRRTSNPNLALLSSRRSGGFGGLDIYFVVNDLRIPFELSGNVTDSRTHRPLNATIRLLDRETNMPVATAVNDTLQQLFVMNMEDIGNFYLQVEAPGYRSIIDDFENPVTRHTRIHRDFTLERILHPYTLDGHVTDERTGRPVMAEILIRPAGRQEVLYRTVSDIVTGFYTFTMEDKVDIDISLRAMEYFDHNESLQLSSVEEDAGTLNFTMQRSVTTFIVTGIVTAEDGASLDANIRITMPLEDQFRQEVTTDEEGRYELIITERGPFLMEVNSEGYFFVNSVLQLNEDSTMIIRNFTMRRMEAGATMVVDNILFATGSATLRPESFTELNRLVNLLRENPGVRIEVSGHTDNVGSAAVNRTLSRNRALSVRNYLVSQGIAAERVQYNGYGFDRPIAPNTTEEGRAANRRVEIEILD